MEVDMYNLPEKLTKDSFWFEVLPELSKIYRNLKQGDKTEISMIYTNKIYSNAVVLLACMLTILSGKSKNPVYIQIANRIEFLAVIDEIGILTQLENLGIVTFEHELYGGFSGIHVDNNYKILNYMPVREYDEFPIEKQLEIRYGKNSEVREKLLSGSFFGMNETPIKNDELWKTTWDTATELIVNAIIYSKSISYAYMQTGVRFNDNKLGYLLAIGDVGRGYYDSLTSKINTPCELDDINSDLTNFKYTVEDRKRFYNKAVELGIDISKEKNFLSMMEALYYSETKSQKMDLYSLKNILSISNANFRIQQGNREVVFTSNKCKNCTKKDTFSCLECVWKSGRECKNSPLRSFPFGMAGVHIEIEFIQEV
jgi:hypothetical protein